MKSMHIALVAATAAALAVPGQAQAAAKAAKANDFNGDGRVDLVVGDTYANSGRVSDSGAVTVTYGGSLRRQVITRNSPGIPGKPEKYGHWGEYLASADFDRDGFADLAVGGYPAPVIIYGSRKGLSARAVTLSAKIAGHSIKAADVDRNGKPDLVVAPQQGIAVYYNVGKGRPRLRAYVSNSPEAEHADIGNHPITGDFNGDGTKDVVTLYIRHTDAQPMNDRRPRLELRLGSRKGLGAPAYTVTTLTSDAQAGDFNGDGVTDLISTDYTDDGDGLRIVYGSARGFSAPVLINTKTPGFPKGPPMGPVPYAGSLFKVGDVDRDGRTDVALSLPDGLGRVLVLRGSKTGLTAKGIRVFTGTDRKDTQFGRAVSLVDLTGDGRAELVVHESLDEAGGTVYVFRNTRGRLEKPKPFPGTRFGFGKQNPEGKTKNVLP